MANSFRTPMSERISCCEMPPSPKLLVSISASRIFRCCTCVGLSSSDVIYKLLDFSDFLPPPPPAASSFDRDDFKSVQFGSVLFAKQKILKFVTVSVSFSFVTRKCLLQESTNVFIFQPGDTVDAFVFRFGLNNTSIRSLTCFAIRFQQ